MYSKLKTFYELSSKFSKYGYHLYLVGGTVRDYLLKIPLSDMDLATDATPFEIEKILPEADFTFSKYGSIKYIDKNKNKFDITTFRKEGRYLDNRHPKYIKFIKDIKVDSKRRDFTINAMYIDDKFNIIDFHHGKEDVEKRILRMIGNPIKRLKEDPLRIIRAIRFSIEFDFKIEERLNKAIFKCSKLLEKINLDKIKMEILKLKDCPKDKMMRYFTKYNLQRYLDVLN